jgi:sarcosine oxidase
MRYDAAVIGLGGMGAAALAHLSARGVRAVGIERFERLHERGSSTGQTRIIRKAYFENPAYVPLLLRAYELWRELEASTGSTLLDLVGVLFAGAPEAEGVAGTLRSARRYDLPVDVLDAGAIAKRFPGTQPRAGEIGVYERDGGIIFPEAAIAAHLDAAAARGATMRFSTRVTGWNKHDGAHRIALEDGSAIEASRLIVCGGAWSGALLADLALPLRVQRNVQVWFTPTNAGYERGGFPAYFVERPELPAPLYGFPAFAGTLKAALHRYGPFVDPDRLDRRITDDDVTAVGNALDGWMEGAAGGYARGRVCTYTLTPDGNFVLDRHPSDASITIACGFSGHGFKFCSVVGEIAAELALDGGTRLDVGFLRLNRF